MSPRIIPGGIRFAPTLLLLCAAGCAVSGRKPSGPAAAGDLRAFPVEPPMWAGTDLTEHRSVRAPDQSQDTPARPVALLSFKHVPAEEWSLLELLTGRAQDDAQLLDEAAVERLFDAAHPESPITRLPDMVLSPEQNAWVAVTRSTPLGDHMVALGDRVFARVTGVTPDAANVQFEWQNASGNGMPPELTTWRVAGNGRMRPGQALAQRVVDENRETTYVIVELTRIGYR